MVEFKPGVPVEAATPVTKRTPPIKLSMRQTVEAHGYFKKNEGSFRGMTFAGVAQVASESLGFPIAVSSVKLIQKEFGLNICVGRQKKEKTPDRLDRLEEEVAELKEVVHTLSEMVRGGFGHQRRETLTTITK